MNNIRGEEYTMDPITRKDLDDALEKFSREIKEYITLVLNPVVDQQKEHHKTLFGSTGSNGLNGTVKVLKWGYGLFALGLGALLAKVFIT